MEALESLHSYFYPPYRVEARKREELGNKRSSPQSVKKLVIDNNS